MISYFTDTIAKLASVDMFARDKNGEFNTGLFVGRPFYIDYEKVHLLVADAWKLKAKGLPRGAFLLAYYENEETVSEALLLRALRPCKLPTDSDMIGSMIEYYKDNLRTSGKQSQLDSFTRYEFGFSGLECRILGTFYKDMRGHTQFGADVENFYSAHNYSAIKPNPETLEAIVNFREGEVSGKPSDVRIGRVRYSSSRRFQEQEDIVPVYVRPQDFLGTRTALFGMTRTGKSNTVKEIIEATVQVSEMAPYHLNSPIELSALELLEPFADNGMPKYPAGQIVFDINGEYANPNLQDAGTAIYELFKEQTTRYSVIRKDGFKVLKVNFFKDVLSGFELVRSHLSQTTGVNHIDSFRSIDLSRPDNYDTNHSAKTRYDRQVAAYLCCLFRAGFSVPKGFKVKFSGNDELNRKVRADGSLDPSKGVTLEEAADWFGTIWDVYDKDPYFSHYKQQKGHEWADEELKAILVFLTRKRQPSGSINVDGYIRLRAIKDLHTDTVDKPFEVEIIEQLREGKIVIVDLSQGDPAIQQLYSERICRQIFNDAMGRFIRNESNNFIQFYFEEAHNLFPKKEDKDLSQIYNRIAKEGAKLNLGMVYATQEVSSISANILKNTQNWFVAHLNNEDEIKEIRKYYDYGDFVESLVRFSAQSDKGFVRMKAYSNPFIVPVQVDRFPASAIEG